MNVLVIGNGGREHAIGYKIKQSPKVTNIYFLPGNGGTSQIGININIDMNQTDKILEFALNNNIDYTIVGPEMPLQNGIVDIFSKHNLKIFGPDKNGAMLETSKAYAKSFMYKYDIPTAKYKVFESYLDAKHNLLDFEFPLVIKADGLASGKGVIICNTLGEAQTTIDNIMNKKVFGSAGDRIIIEEYLDGKEVSLLCFTDGKTIIPMESASDYKRAKDNDKGLNTGGMGSISPSMYYTNNLGNDIAKKTLLGTQQEGFNYKGVIYIGLMITNKGPKVLEYNVRFGDPETEALMVRLDTDFMDIVKSVINQDLNNIKINWKQETSVCVVLASKGYPEGFETGFNINNIVEDKNIEVFHAGTVLKNGEIKTNGGRVLMITALGKDLNNAREQVYNYINNIQCDNLFFRKDIGLIREDQ